MHASSPEVAFSFNNGTLKNNETYSNGQNNAVTSDSIFRIMSVSKNFAAFSALVVENLGKSAAGNTDLLTLETPVRLLLPEFGLPATDWEDGGRDITLRMLASHTSGISREGYSTDFNLVRGTDKADAPTIGADWAGATSDGIIERVNRTGLMFAPGQRAGCECYVTCGWSLLMD